MRFFERLHFLGGEDTYESELKTILESGCEFAKSNPVQVSRARQAWATASKAEKQISAEIQKEGEDIEAPLNSTQTQELEREWEAKYHMTVELRLTGA